jgi:hypothetical protein
MVVDHSIQVDKFGTADALGLNMKIEFERNLERYQFLKWGMQAFDTFKVVPPGVGIVHQVNMEYLARGVMEKDGMAYPDTLVGTDSHTTMINGLGVVAWGVGGIEAEAAMLGQPVYFLTPDVVGVNLTGSVKPGVTATDVVLTITEMLRRAKVVGKFVEFFGEGAAALPVTDRATIANMAPEYGATMGFFPVDEATCQYFAATGRKAAQVDLIRAYYQAQHLFGIPKAGEIDYSQTLSLDLSSVEPSVAGPKRPQDRIPAGANRSRPSNADAEAEGGRRLRQDRRGPAPHLQRRRRPRTAPRPRGHRRDHLVHQHLQSRRDARRRPAGEEGGRIRSIHALPREDQPGPRFARGDRIPESRRPAALPGAARLFAWSATAAPPASATPARCRKRSRRPSSTTIWSPARCCPATATSRRGCTRTSRPTS